MSVAKRFVAPYNVHVYVCTCVCMYMHKGWRDYVWGGGWGGGAVLPSLPCMCALFTTAIPTCTVHVRISHDDTSYSVLPVPVHLFMCLYATILHWRKEEWKKITLRVEKRRNLLRIPMLLPHFVFSLSQLAQHSSTKHLHFEIQVCICKIPPPFLVMSFKTWKWHHWNLRVLIVREKGGAREGPAC